MFMLVERIYKFLASNYGILSGNKFRMTIDEAKDKQTGAITHEGRTKLKDVF